MVYAPRDLGLDLFLEVYSVLVLVIEQIGMVVRSTFFELVHPCGRVLNDLVAEYNYFHFDSLYASF